MIDLICLMHLSWTGWLSWGKVSMLWFFCPKQGQGFNLPSAHVYPNTGQAPTPPPHPPGGRTSDTFKPCCLIFFLFSGDEVPAHLYGKTEFGDNVDNEWFIVSLLLQLSKVFPATCIRWDNYTFSGIYSSSET